VGYQLLPKLLLGRYYGMVFGLCIHLTSQIFSVNHSNSNRKARFTHAEDGEKVRISFRLTSICFPKLE